MTTKVFVYGTLQGKNPVRGLHLFPGASKVNDAVTVGGNFDLYNLGAFPAMTTKGNNNVSGEVWEVDEETMTHLDAIEGYPEFYNRSVIKTSEGDAIAYHIDDIKYYNADLMTPNNGITSWGKS